MKFFALFNLLIFLYLFVLMIQIRLLFYKMNAIRENRKYEGWFSEMLGGTLDISKALNGHYIEAIPLVTLIKSVVNDDVFCEKEEYKGLYKLKLKKDKLFLVIFFILPILILLMEKFEN
jgi:hypothetical protein